jgi:hypothetical protein
MGFLRNFVLLSVALALLGAAGLAHRALYIEYAVQPLAEETVVSGPSGYGLGGRKWFLAPAAVSCKL